MDTISKKLFKTYIDSFDFTKLFNQLGWNYVDQQFPVKLKDETYLFHSVAEKGGFRIVVFKPTAHQELPDYNTRLQLDRKIAKLFREHLIIFCDRNQTTQIWQLFVKQLGKPSRLSETRWHKGQEPELLYQKTSHLFFTLDEEENITITDVVERVNDNFSRNVEQVTKKFYENFRREHQKFIAFIEGISAVTDREWYASLMLNRLMFCYFIQKKGFLDNNPNYLKEKLLACQQRKGKDQFYVSFYKNFLLALFHQGLGSPMHDSDFQKELGRIPYLNGGLFDVHELEKNYSIDIGDDAFIKVFDFFDQYNWHLDTRVAASGKDINPDVIGYIFEKYINDRAQMGAYYTKEDITDYISKNCIIPYLFDETARNYPKAFKPDAEMWQMLSESGDEYIYPAVKHGILLPSPNGEGPGERLLPEEIAIGLDTTQPSLLERRAAWNKPAPAEYALPTEIWREVIDRRNRYTEVKAKIENGEIGQINDFITYNLNIRQFAQDVVENTTDSDFLRHFYKSLNSVTILDPTCGSGAFLFAAMNILEPLYEACIIRMRGFTEDEDDENGEVKSNFSNKYKYFRAVLAGIQNENHPNQAYFIYKSIILNNLYGVDIMKEAVEIAKLRLFLKLVATVEADYRKSNLGLEPLPDVDFNIRAGNTLVGFATEKELEKSLIEDMMGAIVKKEIEERCDIVARAFARYKEIQLGNGNDFNDFKTAKEELNKRLKELNHELNLLLHKQSVSLNYNTWLTTHQPFHWFAEFYEIVKSQSGFDVIIGNPPYVEYKGIEYNLKGYKTLDCGNLYAFVMERALAITRQSGFCGMIVPMSGHSTERMENLVKNFYNKFSGKYLFNISADAHPSMLFDGVKFRLAIFICSNTFRSTCTTRFTRWFAEERNFLFDLISFFKETNFDYKSIIPKISNEFHQSVLVKLLVKRKSLYSLGYFKTYYNNTPIHWIRAHDFIPYFHSERDGEKPSTQLKPLLYDNQSDAEAASAIICSSLYFIWWITISDCYHLNKPELVNFKFDFDDKKCITSLSETYHVLKKDMISKSIRRVYNYKTSGRVEYDEFYLKKSKSIIDEIDKVLAEHYGFTEEELDFIINYDIKYRMGKELEGDV